MTGSRFPSLSKILIVLVALYSLGYQATFSLSNTSTIDKPEGHPTRDYAFMWWAHGWRGRSNEGAKILNVQTSSYGLALDVEKATLSHLGPIEVAVDYLSAAAEENSRVFSLPKPDFHLKVIVGATAYTCVRVNPNAASSLETAVWPGDTPEKTSETNGHHSRLICSGRFVQRADLLYLEFEDAIGNLLPALGRLEIIAWPDRANFLLELTSKTSLEEVRLDLQLEDGEGIRKRTTPPQSLNPGAKLSEYLTWTPLENVEERTPEIEVGVKTAEGASLPVIYEATGSWNRVRLRSEGRDVAEDPNHQDRFPLKIENPTDQEQIVRLFFEFDGTDVPPITGFSPLLLDPSGQPTGIPVQISKNWHRPEGANFLYQGPWFHGYSMIRLAPHEIWEGQFCLATAHWGGAPAASHSQLSLIGWGTNQLWDQVAIGSWGESICYDPDVNLNRSMIDDVRPLMVWGMRDEEHAKWTWTNNVGGGDFLVYFDEKGEKQFLTRMKTAYLRYCPNLTEVTYAGVTADRKIAARITVSTPRSDDINRAFHHIRYDVLEPTSFSRLAFYQVGADHYNDQQFERLAMGNAEGLIEEWAVEKGGLRYWKRGLPCSGAAPWWFSLHDAHPVRESKGAWANRSLIVRSWKAKLGGKEIPIPYASFYGTQDGFPGANVEIAPPPGQSHLEPGDYVEADLELAIVPMSASDYYGPNEPLRQALSKDANTWKIVQREAIGNDLKVECLLGSLKRSYPIVIEVDENDSAEFSVSGGVGYIPITFTGLDGPYDFDLFRNANGQDERVDQSQHGNDFWQTDYNPGLDCWERTYNLTMEGGTRLLRFSPSRTNQ